jgi:hypothetical protein
MADEPGPPSRAADIVAVEDRLMDLFERIAASQEARLPPRHELLGEPEPGDDAGSGCTRWQPGCRWARRTGTRLAAPTAAGRLDALRDAVETVAAMIEFQLADGGAPD